MKRRRLPLTAQIGVFQKKMWERKSSSCLRRDAEENGHSREGEDGPDEDEADEEEDDDGTSFANCKRLLLVEDVRVSQKIASVALRKKKYEVEVAGDGADAVDKFRKYKYKIVLMDIQVGFFEGDPIGVPSAECECSCQN